MPQSSSLLNMCYNHQPGILEQVLGEITSYKVFAVSSILHVGASAARTCTNVIIPLPFIVRQATYAISEPRTSEDNAFLIQNFAAMK